MRDEIVDECRENEEFKQCTKQCEPTCFDRNPVSIPLSLPHLSSPQFRSVLPLSVALPVASVLLVIFVSPFMNQFVFLLRCVPRRKQFGDADEYCRTISIDLSINACTYLCQYFFMFSK